MKEKHFTPVPIISC